MEYVYGWYNFRTGQHDNLSGTPEDFSDYIPQLEAARGMYECYLALGEPPIEAALKTLEACAGINKK